jgi:hypothetical protein
MAEHKPPEAGSAQQEQAGGSGHRSSAKDPSERRARRKAQVSKTMEQEARRKNKPLSAQGAGAGTGSKILDHSAETREDAAYRTEGVLTSTSQGGRLSPPREQRKPAISLGEISEARLEVKQRQAAVIEEVQRLLDSLVGRRGTTEAENKQIADLVYDIARNSGTDLLCEGQRAHIRWSSGVFEARTTDARRITLCQSADFPPLTARAKAHEREAGLSI